MPKPTKAKATTKAPRTVHDKLLEAVGAVDRPGTFCTSSDLPLVMPGLEVDGREHGDAGGNQKTRIE